MAGLRICVITLGCKVNQCDGDEMARALAARGYGIADRDEAADIYLVNTCTVTATADAKARKLIRKLAREHPRSRLIVTGCGAERHAEAVGLPGVVVVPNARKGEIEGAVARAMAGGHGEMARPASQAAMAVHLATCPPYSGRGKPPSLEELRCPGPLPNNRVPAELKRTRAFVKVQDGCDRRCTYCVVPEARGRPASRPVSEVLEEMQGLARSGAQEVVLCGIRLGAYGRDSGDGSLATLLHELRQIDIPRLRLSSIEPMDFGEDLLSEIADHPRLCHHLHLPLQSGDDAVLAAMGRGYDSAEYAGLVLAIRSAWPDAAITTDVMVGFPGETEGQFERTARFVREMGFTRVHVFPYSPRPGTLAAQHPDQIAGHVKRERATRLLTIAKELAQAAARAWVGRKVSVLFEERDREGCLRGLTEHYLRVRCPGPEGLVGQMVKVVPHEAVRGELVAKCGGAR